MAVSEYKVVMLESQRSPLGQVVTSAFAATVVHNLTELAELKAEDYSLFLVDTFSNELDIREVRGAFGAECAGQKGVPLVVLTEVTDIKQKLKWFDHGADDVIESGISEEELVLRCRKLIFNQIAMNQLAQRLNAATNTARVALDDNGDLGANVQFLLALHECDDLDQLGQMYFSAVARYGIKCSLQMRSLMEIKNMEPSGMARHLESQLLTHLKDKGRFIDHGRRTIINYDRVSLLIKNMPTDDPEKYGAIKDNIFSLLQGVNARVLSLEDQYRLEKEKASLEKLSRDIYSTIDVIHNSYHEVMKKIALTVENTAEEMLYRIPVLSLSETDEDFFEGLANRSISETNRIFNDGLKINECVQKIEGMLELAVHEKQSTSMRDLSAGEQSGGSVNSNMVELF